MARKTKKDKIFNDRPRKVFRKRISPVEITFSVFFIFIVVAMGTWFFAQRDNFNPEDRDVGMAAMIDGAVVDTLYRKPFVPWIDPELVQGGAVPAVYTGIFPSGILAGGWKISSRVQDFSPKTLYEKINGAADQYINFGLVAMHYVSIEKASEDAEIIVEIYDMGSFPNALGIFAAQRDAGKAVDRLDDAYYFPTSAGAIGIVNSFYFKISGNKDAPVIHDKAAELLQQIMTIENEAAAMPETFAVLSQKLNVPFDGIEYVKNDVFQFSFAQDFWFGQPSVESQWRYFIHKAGSSEEAAGLVEKIVENQLFDYSLVEKRDDMVVLKHDFLNYFNIMQEGGWIFGIEGAEELGPLEESSNLLRGVLAQ